VRRQAQMRKTVQVAKMMSQAAATLSLQSLLAVGMRVQVIRMDTVMLHQATAQGLNIHWGSSQVNTSSPTQCSG
jgi:hypothetical protein